MTQTWKPRELGPADLATAPNAEGLIGYLRDADDFKKTLTAEKAVLFRGFDIAPEELDAVLDPALPRRLAYVQGNSPRTKVGRNVYTSTEYPSHLTISMHNELSYASSWPDRLAFYCEQEPTTSGATPLVDGALWLESLDAEIQQAFAGGVRYLQNLHDGYGLGKSWQQTFESDDRAEVDAFLSEAAADWQWRSDGGLRIEQVRQATFRHPSTGTEVWFNQADQWHPEGLGDAIAATLAKALAPDDLPQAVTFADGSPIPGEYVQQIRERGLDAAVDVDWRRGDLLVIDNVLVAHGRRPFTGPRRVLVAMSGSEQ